MYLKEDMELHKGIFWVKDPDNISESFLYFTVDCTADGESIFDPTIQYSSNSGLTYNHANTWSKLQSKITNNKPFNYYPRGRVEIRHGVATIWCSPFIFSDELKEICIDKFNLTEPNGIKKVVMKADNSEHYKCYLN